LRFELWLLLWQAQYLDPAKVIDMKVRFVWRWRTHQLITLPRGADGWLTVKWRLWLSREQAQYQEAAKVIDVKKDGKP
jgi:hypothetical protein